MVTGVLCLLESDSLSKKLTLVAYSTGWFQEQIENHWISRKTSLTLKLEYLYQTEDKKKHLLDILYQVRKTVLCTGKIKARFVKLFKMLASL